MTKRILGIDFHIASSGAGMQIGRMDRAVILGASRGLGAEMVRHGCSQLRYPIVGFGRKAERLQELRERFPLFEYRVTDFSTHGGQDEAIRYLLQADFAKLFIVAGGGPYGRFEERNTKDHQWALEVSFLFPMRVLHALLVANKKVPTFVVGSAVAESQPDPLAASYCAAKHALKGLLMSVRAENPTWDLRLFSPGYMDTEMLPKNAPARQQGVYNPAQIAADLWLWSLSADDSGHKLYPKHPA